MASAESRRPKPVPVPRVARSSENSPRNNMTDPTSIGSRSAQAMAAAAMSMRNQQQLNDVKAKTVLKEAIDAVVNSFAKHTQGYGRGMFSSGILSFRTITLSYQLLSYNFVPKNYHFVLCIDHFLP